MNNKELIDEIGRFKTILISIATNEEYDDKEYALLRTKLISNHQLKDLVPDFIKINLTPREFFYYVQGLYGHYKGRTAFITKEMNKMIYYLESDASYENSPNNNAKQYDVFISHSSKDKKLALILVAFLVKIGIEKRNIFFTSLTETGVNKSIRKDVRDALKTSKFFFIILSSNYLNSIYCLNEEGAIWYKTENYVLYAGDDFDADDLVGFINNDIYVRRFSNKEDYIKTFNILKDILRIECDQTLLDNVSNKGVEAYLKISQWLLIGKHSNILYL